MKKVLILALLIISACSSKKAFMNNSRSEFPEWMNDNSELTAVGIATPSVGGIKLQLAKAELDAKGNLAAKINSEISRITKDAIRSASVNENDDVEDFFAQATKEVVSNLPLSGVYREKMFVAKDGTLYVLVRMDSEKFSKFLDRQERSLIKKLHNSNLSRENIKASEEASKEIFNELEKERN